MTGLSTILRAKSPATFALATSLLVDVQSGTFTGSCLGNENGTANSSGLNVAAQNLTDAGDDIAYQITTLPYPARQTTLRAAPHHGAGNIVHLSGPAD